MEIVEKAHEAPTSRNRSPGKSTECEIGPCSEFNTSTRAFSRYRYLTAVRFHALSAHLFSTKARGSRDGNLLPVFVCHRPSTKTYDLEFEYVECVLVSVTSTHEGSLNV